MGPTTGDWRHIPENSRVKHFELLGFEFFLVVLFFLFWQGPDILKAEDQSMWPLCAETWFGISCVVFFFIIIHLELGYTRE